MRHLCKNKYAARLEELRKLGIRGTIFRINYELSKKLGLVERKHAAVKLSDEDVIRSLDLENIALSNVRDAYNSQGVESAIAKLISHLKSRQSPRFFFDWRCRDSYHKLIKSHFSDQEAHLVERAGKICQNEFEIFDSTSVTFGNTVNWHLDPETGKDWPVIPWPKIDIRGTDRIGDVKFTWEVNRHQFFFDLGRAYWFTGDQKYARKFADLLRSWIDANPPEIGVNWYSNMEVAIRLISWIWAYHYFLDSPFFDDGLHLDFLKTVLHSCRHITKDFQYSLYSMRNNHVIGDAAGLVFASIMFPEFKESKRWMKTYIDILYRELDVQVYNDGTDFEQAISYHRFVLYFYLLLLRIMQVNNYSFPVHFGKKIEKMMDFMLYVMKPDGTISQIGDYDDAKVLPLSNDSSSSLKPILSTGAVLFKRGDFKWAAGRLSEETFWLSGQESVNIFNSLEESIPPNLSKGFPDGGYYIMRSGDNTNARYLLFKCGPSADHGHADDLHIEVYSDGKSYLQDSGTYMYNGPWEWRTFFRSTNAHNTVLVDGESQRIPYRSFRWLKVADTRTISWITSKNFDYVEAEHDGYKRKTVIHRRAVFFVKPDYWVIVDRLIGSGKHLVELFFQTPFTEYEVESSKKIFRIKEFAIIPVISDNFEVKIHQASDEPIQGWFSPHYGVKLPSTTIVYACNSELPIAMATILDPGCSILDAGYSISNSDNLIINVRLSKSNDTLIFNWGQKFPEGIDTDAELAYLREDIASSKLTRIGLVHGSYIRKEEKTLIKAESRAKSIDMMLLPSGEVRMEMKR